MKNAITCWNNEISSILFYQLYITFTTIFNRKIFANFVSTRNSLHRQFLLTITVNCCDKLVFR